MRLEKMRSCVGVWALVFGLVAFTCGELLAEPEEDARWSIDFGAISISEAFDQLTRITGIKIFTTTPLAHKISPKRYVDQSIDQILKDMLKNVNYAAVWLYGKRGLESIGISPFDRDRGESPATLLGVEGTGAVNRHLQRNAGSRQLRLGRGVSGPERASRRRLLQKPEQGHSAGVADEDDSETEDKDEEPVSPPTELSDTSSVASSDSQVESPTDSSNEQEGSSTDQQDKGEESVSSMSSEEARGDKE